MTDFEKEAKAAIKDIEDAVRVRTPERIALRMAIIMAGGCLLLGFIAGKVL